MRTQKYVDTYCIRLSNYITPNTMVINFWPKKSSGGIVKSLSEANFQKAQNGPSTQLIESTSCVELEWSNATIKAKELS